MALITKSIIAAGGGDFTTIQGFVDWVVANYAGAGWNAGGIRGVINDSATYAEQVSLNGDLRPTAVSPFEIVAGTACTPIISLGATASAKAIAFTSTWTNISDGVRFAGLTITGTGSGQVGFDVSPAANKGSGGVIENCIVTLTGAATTYGVVRSFVSDAGHWRIRCCRFKSCTYGVNALNGTGYPTMLVYNCQFCDCTYGVYGDIYRTWVLKVLHCTFLRCGTGIKIDNWGYNPWGSLLDWTTKEGFTVRNCIFRTCTGGLSLAGTNAVFYQPCLSFDGNDYHDNTNDIYFNATNYTLAQWQALAGLPDQNSLAVDPEFASEVSGSEDLTPTADGILGRAPSAGLSTDYLGDTRANGRNCTPGSEEGTYGAAVTPTGFALFDPGTGGELWGTIDNIDDFSDTDLLFVTTAAGGPILLGNLAVLDVASYKFRGYIPIGKLTAGCEYKLQVKASSDGVTFSSDSDSATETPTAPWATAAAVAALPQKADVIDARDPTATTRAQLDMLLLAYVNGISDWEDVAGVIHAYYKSRDGTKKRIDAIMTGKERLTAPVNDWSI